MSKKKAPTASVPAPSFYQDPYYQKAQDLLFPIAQGLSSGGFLNPDNQSVGFLNPLVSLNPEATQAAVGLAQRNVDQQQQQAYRQIINELAANNQLESSVTGNRLADLQRDYGRNITDINTNAYLNDVNRVYTNLSDLFKTGLGLGSNISSQALSNQGQRNQFNLNNFQNQVTSEMLSKPVAQQGGILGALEGGLGGGLSGFVLSGGNPFAAAAGAGVGALSGGFGSPGNGGNILNAGALNYGLGRMGNFAPAAPSYIPGTSASNDPYGRLTAQGVGLKSGDDLLDRYFGYGGWN